MSQPLDNFIVEDYGSGRKLREDVIAIDIGQRIPRQLQVTLVSMLSAQNKKEILKYIIIKVELRKDFCLGWGNNKAPDNSGVRISKA